MFTESTLTFILQWVLPAGGFSALFGSILWVKLFTTRAEKEKHATYHAMYHDAVDDLANTINEKRNLENRIQQLEEDVRLLLEFVRRVASSRSPMARLAATFLRHYEASQRERQQAELAASLRADGQHRPRDSDLEADRGSGSRYDTIEGVDVGADWPAAEGEL